MLHRPRKPRWTHTLLNAQDEPLMRLDGVTGGQIVSQGLTRLGGYGTLEIDDTGQDIDWMQHRVQSVYDPGIEGVEPWPAGTMLLSSPQELRSGPLLKYSVGTRPKTAVIEEDAFPDVFSLPAGEPIIPAVVRVIESTGETRIAATPSDAVLANPQSWPASEPKLTIVNELLKAAGYWTLWCDRAGQFRVEPYIDPAERPVAYSFVAGDESIHSAEWSREQDLSSVPNRFIVVGQGGENAPPLVGVAENTNPESRFSFQSRGKRWITRKEEGVEGASQQVFDQLAQRRLLGAMSPVEHLGVKHEFVPLDPNQIVYFESDGYTGRLQVQNMTIGFGLEDWCEAEWRRTDV